MKRLVYILILLVTGVAIANATQVDNYAEKQQRLLEQPRTVLKEARLTVGDALRKGLSTELIDALMQLSAAQLLIDTDSVAAVVAEVEQVMNSCRNEVDRSVIALYLSKLYRGYADSHYSLRNRPYVEGNTDVDTWSYRNYTDAADSLLLVAVEPAVLLQKTPLKRYRSVMQLNGYEGRDAWRIAERFMPSMYDFVVEQVVDGYSENDSLVAQLIDNTIAYHNRRKNKAASFAWQLKRVQRNMIEDEAETLLTLDSLIAHNARHDYVIDAVILRDEYATDDDDATSIRRRYDALQEWIALYPRYYRTGCLRSACATMAQAHISIELPTVNYPNEPITVAVRHKNADRLQYRLVRFNDLMIDRLNFYNKPMSSDTTTIVEDILTLSQDTQPTFILQDSQIVLPALQPGVYSLMAYSGDEAQSYCNFVVTPYMLFAIQPDATQLSTVLVDNRSGQPIEGVMVHLVTKQGVVLQQTVTNELGISSFLHPSGDEQLYVQLADSAIYPIRLRANFYAESAVEYGTQAHIFTDRSLYRPGHTLQFSAIVYRNDSEMHHVKPDATVYARLYDHSHNVVWCDTLVTDRWGMVSDTVVLPPNASMGTWRLVVEGDKLYTSRSIEVAEYKRPQFRVVFNPIEGAYAYGDSVQVTGVAESYAAVPLRYATVNYVVRQTSWYYGGGKEIARGSVATDEKGQFAVHFATLPPEDTLWRRWGTRYIVEATVTSSTGESQQCETSVSVQGTAVLFRFNLPNVICKENATPFTVAITNSDGTPLQQAYRVTLCSLATSGVDEPLSSLQVRDTVWSQSYKTTGDSIMLPYAQLPSGAYRLYFITHDLNNECVTDSTQFVLYSPTDVTPPVPTALWCPVSRAVVGDGEVARFQLGTSFNDASLLYYVIDNDSLIDCKRVALDNSITTIEIPFKPTYTDAVQVQLVMVRDKKLYEQRLKVTRRQPDKRLTITPTTFRDKTVAGSSEKWQFSVRDANGNPVDALFMAELYDASLDALRRHAWRFNATYTPNVPYIPVHQLWGYDSEQRGNISYWNGGIEGVKCYPSVGVQLQSYIYSDSYVGRWSNGMTMRMTTMSYAELATAPRMMTKAVPTNADMAEIESEAIMVEEVADASMPEQHSDNVPFTYRENMNETAFFYPHLVTNKEGNVAVEFTLPESNTTWNFLSLALTPDLYNGVYNTQVVSSKPLMVVPNMPRFLRQGDKTVIAMSVQNTTSGTLQGKARLALFVPDSDREIVVVEEPFTVAGNESATVRFAVTIPDTLSLVGVRVGASTPLYSDGEQHLLAVLPSTVFVTESCPFYLAPTVADTTVTFASMQENISREGVDTYRLTLEYCDNPAWYAVTALPALAQPDNNSATAIAASLYANTVATGIVRQNPALAQAIAKWSNQANGESLTSMLQKNEELKAILLSQTPWLLDAENNTEQLHKIASLLDVDKAQKLRQWAVEQLLALQSSEGGWSWFKGMDPSYWMTLNITTILSRLSQWGETESDEAVTLMLAQALRYIDSEYVHRNIDTPRSIDYYDVCYLYARSAFRDIPLGDKALAIHKAQLDTLAQSWYRLGDVERAYAAVALHRYGYSQVATDIVNSLREYATTTPSQGMFWANNRSHSFYQNSAVQVHCAIYEAFATVAPDTALLDAMRQWLLLQKQTNMWSSVPSTLDAVNVLLTSGSNWLSQGMTSHIQWGNTPLPATSQADDIMGYAKFVRNGDAVDAADATLSVTHHDHTPSWGALYWQYYDHIADVARYSSAEIALDRAYYVEREGKLLPIETTTLHNGDVVTVRLKLNVDRDMQFVTLTDSRPACFEPLRQLPDYDYADNTFYYRVPDDAATTFYIEHLTRGTHIIQYEVYVDRIGSYQAGIATVQSYYAPQYAAHTAGASVVIGNVK